MTPSKTNLPGRSSGITNLVDARILHRNDAVFGFVDELLIDLSSGRVAYIIGRRHDGSRTSIHWDLLEYCSGDFRFRSATVSSLRTMRPI